MNKTPNIGQLSPTVIDSLTISAKPTKKVVPAPGRYTTTSSIIAHFKVNCKRKNKIIQSSSS